MSDDSEREINVRHQVVWSRRGLADDERTLFWLCPIRLHPVGGLAEWGNDPGQMAETFGGSQYALGLFAGMLLRDVVGYKPVEFETLHIGMKFEQTGVSMKQLTEVLNRVIAKAGAQECAESQPGDQSAGETSQTGGGNE